MWLRIKAISNIRDINFGLALTCVRATPSIRKALHWLHKGCTFPIRKTTINSLWRWLFIIRTLICLIIKVMWGRFCWCSFDETGARLCFSFSHITGRVTSCRSYGGWLETHAWVFWYMMPFWRFSSSTTNVSKVWWLAEKGKSKEEIRW